MRRAIINPVSNSLRFRLIIISLVLALAAQAFPLPGQHLAFAQNVTEDEFWRDIGENRINNRKSRAIFPASYRTCRLNKRVFNRAISGAALEGSVQAASTEIFVTMPMPDGGVGRFRIEESPIMEPALAAKFPELKTYQGQSVDDPSVSMRFGWSPDGLHAIILSSKGIVLIFPYAEKNARDYIVYFSQEDSEEILQKQCLVTEDEVRASGIRRQSQDDVTANVSSGSVLRTYRLALAATAEFTQQYGGGSVTQAQTALTQNINLINAIFRRELSVSLNLINNTSIIFTDPNTDGYTNSNVGTMMSENQTKLDSVIGSANYDIGHVYGAITGLPQGARSFSGIAGIGVACVTGQKARGASVMGGGATTDAIFVNGITHEFGHQFDATHTFNTSVSPCGSSRTAQSAWEPGSGSTIMAYSICGNETLQPTTDTYFHTGSLEQMVAFVTTTGNCAAQSSTGNRVPSVDAGPNYTIPSRTPFALTATAGDPDGDPLTYGWEEYDLGTASPPNTDDGSRPIFRSYLPVASPTRFFPSLKYILNNANDPPQTYTLSGKTYTTGEALPTTNRTMNFRATVRDNRAAGGAVQSDAMQVTVVATAGPFRVTQPNTGLAWQGGGVQPVTWDVAGTNLPPISTATVRISLSTDGGNSFPIILANSTPNDGVEAVQVPNISASQARVKVEAVGNIFFDISDVNFPINSLPGGGSKAPFDFDGDGKSDLSLFRASNNTWLIIRSSDGVLTSRVWGFGSDRLVPADYDGDGKADIAVWRPSDGTWYIINSSTGGGRFQQWGLSTDVPVPGDYDGDNRADLAIWRPSTGTWWIINSSNGSVRSQQWGLSTDKPVPRDYDGDGKTDLAVWRPSNGTWYIINSSTGSGRERGWGLSTDVLVPADYDGDGKADIAVWRPSDGSWNIINSSTGGGRFQNWGLSTDVPVPADYDGDGKTDISIFRPSDGTWWIIKSSDSGVINRQFGTSGDVPVPSAYTVR